MLSSRCALAGAEILSAILKDFTRYWKQAKPQNEKLASEYAEPGNDLRTFDWKKPVKELLRTNRAFGHYGCLAFVDGKKLIVTNCNGWEENTASTPERLPASCPMS